MNTNVYIPCCVLTLLLIGKAPAQKHTAGRQQTIVAVDGLVLGVRVGAAWQAVDQSFAKGMRAIRFTPVTLDGVGKPFGPVGLVSDEFPQGCYIEAKSVPIAVNVAGIKPSVPRKPRIVRPTTKDQQLVAAHLKAAGFGKAPVKVSRVIEVDLDGNGTREALIEARSRENLNRAVPGPSALDYSLVLLRVGSKVQRLELSGGTHGAVELNQVRAVVDLDGDGRMEIVTEGDGYEWDDGTIWAYRSGKAKRLFGNWGGV